MDFLPSSAVMLSYSFACLALFITPGPDMSLFLQKTIEGGRRAGIAAMLGALSGCLLHSFAAAFGLSALIAASPKAFAALKIIGALYLLFLAWQAVKAGSALSVKTGAQAELPLFKTWLLGLGINLTNPKVVLFFITFLPQFINAGDPHAAQKMLFLGTYFVVFSIPLALAMIFLAERFIESLARNPRIARTIDYAFAAVFAGFALKILLADLL